MFAESDSSRVKNIHICCPRTRRQKEKQKKEPQIENSAHPPYIACHPPLCSGYSCFRNIYIYTCKKNFHDTFTRAQARSQSQTSTRAQARSYSQTSTRAQARSQPQTSTRAQAMSYSRTRRSELGPLGEDLQVPGLAGQS